MPGLAQVVNMAFDRRPRVEPAAIQSRRCRQWGAYATFPSIFSLARPEHPWLWCRSVLAQGRASTSLDKKLDSTMRLFVSPCPLLAPYGIRIGVAAVHHRRRFFCATDDGTGTLGTASGHGVSVASGHRSSPVPQGAELARSAPHGAVPQLPGFEPAPATVVYQIATHNPIKDFLAMAQSTKHPSTEHHHNAAAAHQAAAHHHHQAAHHHSQGKHDEAKAHATAAHEHSDTAHKHSTTAHGHSQK